MMNSKVSIKNKLELSVKHFYHQLGFFIFDKHSLRTWIGIGRGLLRVHHDLTMVLCFADFDTRTNKNGDNNGQPNDTPNHSASYRSSRRRRTKYKQIRFAY